MCAKPPALWKSITKGINSQRGDAMIWGIALVVAIVLFFGVFFEKWRVQSITEEASRKIATTITSLASSHIYDSYRPIRDGTSGAFVFDGDSFTEIKDTTSFYTMFTKLHDNAVQVGDAVRAAHPKGYLYEISNVVIWVSNATDGTVRSKYRVMYTLEIPQDLLWKGSTITLNNQLQRVEYKEKY